jgi:hypothetical protein
MRVKPEAGVNRSESSPGYNPDMILVGWDGLAPAGLERGDDDFWPSSLSRSGAMIRLDGDSAGESVRFWQGCLSPAPDGGPSESLFSRLSGRGLSVALVNLPWPAQPQGNEEFFIGRSPTPDRPPLVHPPELALDLADYVGDPPSPALENASKFSRGLADLAFAEQAAVCRIRFEHTLRLALERRPAVVAVSLGGFDLITSMGTGSKRRLESFRAQLSHYGAALEHRLGPRSLAVLSCNGPSRPGLVLARGPGLAPGRDMGPLTMGEAARLLEELALAAHASAEKSS